MEGDSVTKSCSGTRRKKLRSLNLKNLKLRDVNLKELMENSLRLLRRKWQMVAVICLLLFIPLIYGLNSSSAVLIVVDKQPLAVVENESQGKEILENVKNEVAEQYGIAIAGFDTEISFKEGDSKDDSMLLTGEELNEALKKRINWLADCWVIDITGKPKLYLASEEAAQKALESVKRQYLPTEDEQLEILETKFMEEVEIVAAAGPLKELITEAQAVEKMVRGLDKIIQHTVKNGDSLWSIAHANDLTVSDLQEMNPQLTGTLLQPGQELNLVKAEPLLTVVTTYQTTVEEKIPYKTVYESDSSMWRGQQSVVCSGVNGQREVTYRVTTVNDIETQKESIIEKILEEPVSRIVKSGTKVIMASRGDGGSGKLGWPLRGRLTSYYGWRGREFHTGLDIDGVTGDPIYAAEDGVVIERGWRGNYGYCVAIDHGDGLSTLYAHLSSIGVSMGQTVSRGDVIGRCGSTGRSTGSHLHFEVRINGSHKNPLNFLDR